MAFLKWARRLVPFEIKSGILKIAILKIILAVVEPEDFDDGSFRSFWPKSVLDGGNATVRNTFTLGPPVWSR